jgi:adenosylcobinamide-GDP ribazoletransferase
MQPTANPPAGLLDRCVHQVRLFFIALQFFTRVPVPRWVGFEPAWLHHASRYLPAVGALVGAVAAAVYALAAWVWPQPVAVLLSTAAGIYLTGAFHEDGFADACDGLGGGMTRERALEIMKDSRIGSYGAVGIGLLLALKCVALASLPNYATAAALLVAHPLSRLAAISLVLRLDYAKVEGKAKPLATHMSNLEYAIAAFTALLPAAVLGFIGLVAWPAMLAGGVAMALATVWLARLFMRRIGGYTGDCLGAVQQVTEVAFYLAVLAVVA